MCRLTLAAAAGATSQPRETDGHAMLTSEQGDDILVAFHSISDSFSAQFVAARQGATSGPSLEVREEAMAGKEED